MIRICVYDSRGKLTGMIDSDLAEITVGRALSCNVIVPDYQVQPVELRIVREAAGAVRIVRGSDDQRLTGLKALKAGRHSVVVTDLKHYAEADTPVPASSSGWGSIAALSAAIMIFAFVDVFWGATDPQFGEWVREIGVAFGLAVVLSAGFAGLSWVLNGEWRYARLLRLAQLAVLMLMAALVDWFNLRWLLPAVFQYEALWQFFALIPTFFFLHKMVKTSMEQTSRALQNVVGLIPLLVLVVAILLRHLPPQQDYRHPQITLRPPLPEFMETTSEKPENAVAEIRKFLNQ